MATEQPYHDPFAIHNLFTLPALDDDISSAWQLSAFEKSLTSTTFLVDEPHDEKLELLKTDLFYLNLDPDSFPDLDSSTDSAVATDAEGDGALSDKNRAGTETEEYIWTLPDVVYGTRADRLLSWDEFLEETHTEPIPAYLSEYQAGTFGLLLQSSKHSADQTVLKPAKPDIFLSSLRELSLGRESICFSYDPEGPAFASRYENYTLADVSVDVMSSVVLDFLQLGNDMRALRAFVSEEFGLPRHRMRKALSAAIHNMTFALETHVEESGFDTMSLLQMQETIRRPGIVMASLRILTKSCSEHDEDLASLVRVCDDLVAEHPWLRGALQEALSRVACSQIEALAQSVGLGTTSLSSCISLNNNTTEENLDRQLLAPDTAEVLVESQQALVLMNQSCADHVLFARSSNSDANLQWEYSWDAISKLQIKAAEYETSLKAVILDLRPTSSSDTLLRSSSAAEEELAATSTSQDLFDLNPEAPALSQTALGNEVSWSQDALFQAVNAAFSTTDFYPSDTQPDLTQSMSLSLMPLLTSQHRLLSYSILSLLFETHDLQTHLRTQSRFQLLGDGLFASRLSHALFDSTEASGEGRRRKGGRTGLRLQDRDTWPPASSELRLALMGILSESVSTGDSSKQKPTTSTLLESLSFAIRDLTDEDLKKCRDVDTIHALDFLALQYKPPTHMLKAIITQRSLKLYDGIFMHLLRLLRLKSTTQELVRHVTGRGRPSLTGTANDRKMRLEVHHFVSTLADWAQNTVIGCKWASFATTLDQVEECLRRRDYDGVLRVGRGLEYIKSLHEGVIDDIARTLFLKRRCMEVRAVLADTFNIVLELAKHTRIEQSSDGGSGHDETIRRLYERFGKQVKRFLAYLRSNANESQDQRDSRGPEALMEQLALRLDIFGFYAEEA